ncbi:ARHGAP39 [Branchiostoma lanceolatum]|uniref:Rho GTPase-activating protein 39 n=1 Tax=Branchiostoma lanceolatum TaxID=7740 RepID=A0A8K0EJ93_BRALA|nr:ARHGAP39 [Branchiostoma lanceolatum]
MSLAGERADWVEIIEPKSREIMFANLVTGECVWDLPVGVAVKKAHDNQWWELFDNNTSRYYYYNAHSQKTVWHRPKNADIVPLAKLQKLKENTEIQERQEREKELRERAMRNKTPQQNGTDSRQGDSRHGTPRKIDSPQTRKQSLNQSLTTFQGKPSTPDHLNNYDKSALQSAQSRKRSREGPQNIDNPSYLDTGKVETHASKFRDQQRQGSPVVLRKNAQEIMDNRAMNIAHSRQGSKASQGSQGSYDSQGNLVGNNENLNYNGNNYTSAQKENNDSISHSRQGSKLSDRDRPVHNDYVELKREGGIPNSDYANIEIIRSVSKKTTPPPPPQVSDYQNAEMFRITQSTPQVNTQASDLQTPGTGAYSSGDLTTTGTSSNAPSSSGYTPGVLKESQVPNLEGSFRDKPRNQVERSSSDGERAGSYGKRQAPNLPTSQSEGEIGAKVRRGSNRSMPGPSRSLGSLLKAKKPQGDVDIMSYAKDNFNRHKKGLFRKPVSIATMLTWTKDPIKKPMIMTRDKTVKKEAVEVFRLIQIFMSDRTVKKIDQMSVALDITTRGWTIQGLRDEVYIQVIRQTSDNKKIESLQKGWELMAICLAFFPPTAKFQSYLEGYIYRFLETETDDDLEGFPRSLYAQHCYKQLDRICKTGARKGLKKPTIDEVAQAKHNIFHPSMFGNTLDDIMNMQKQRYPERRLPWIQTTLSNEVLKLGGERTEGIFRVPGDIDDVNALKVQMDRWELPNEIMDPHVPGSLLKLWYRELYEPLIPPSYYRRCVDSYDNPEAAIAVIQSLPEINRLVLCYLLNFLQVFARSENSKVTKMDASNLAMVMAPNCLRCESDDPREIFENTRKEMSFLRTLLLNMDTEFMSGVE